MKENDLNSFTRKMGLFSQSELLARYGGVAPKMAEEAHSRVIDEV